MRIEVIAGVRATPQGHAVLSGVVGGVLSAPAKPQAGKAVVASGAAHSAYRLTLRVADGRRLLVYRSAIPAGLRVGSLVRLSAGRLVLVR